MNIIVALFSRILEPEAMNNEAKKNKSTTLPQDIEEHPLINVAPKALHPLLTHTQEVRANPKSIARFLGGLAVGFGSFKFLIKNPSLWSAALIPAMINIFLFLITTSVLFYYSGPFVDGIWHRPEAWYWIILWWVFRILIYPLLLALSYFFTLIIGTVIAAPFLTTLSEKTESIFVGYPVKGPTDMASNIRGAMTALVYVSGYITLMLPILFLNFLPVIGFVATILGGMISSFFLALEYSDYVLDRRSYSLKQKFKTIWNEKPLSMGFGLGTSFLLWVPMVNFLTMPIAVIGGTAIAIALDEHDEHEENIAVEN